jgi:hypothetical protein
MKVTEYSKPSGFALAVILTPADAGEIAAEFARGRQAISEWFQRRAPRCELVLFSIVVDNALVPAIEAKLSRLLLDDVQLASILVQVETEALIINTQGKEVGKRTLTQRPRSGGGASATKKPWWKFW